jgi:hypothetical protein
MPRCKELDSLQGISRNPVSRSLISTMDRTKYLSRAAAARALGVKASTFERLAAKHNIRTFQVPGHCRKWFDRRDVETLLAAAVGTGARA